MRSSARASEGTVGSLAVRDIDAVLPVFARDAPGRSMEPATGAAERLLAGTDAARARRILDAATSLADERPDSALRGLVLPDSPDALQGWWRLRELSDDLARTPHDPEAAEMTASPVLHFPEEHAARATREFASSAHYNQGFIVDLQGSSLRSLLTRDGAGYERLLRETMGDDPDLIASILERDAGEGLRRVRADEVAMLMHEVEHADGLLDYMTGTPARAELTRIFEEGGNNVITHWPGRRTAFAERAGLVDEIGRFALEDTTPGSYADETEVMRDIVRRAGIDIGDPRAAADAVLLLRGRRHYDVAIEDAARAVSVHEGRDVNPHELQQSMLRTPKSDALRARLAAEAIAASAGTMLG